ncbi:hypothetical protein TELCIR_07050 [Teladorsagia circumcincta]|uniref:Integrase catalytic domain-containing protein n=1 Tax=Teladorsagia circumcincta TaxID=45464 RepID=A0A2G9ULF6_TELCI|nr:hypothetical protein TELCIR_07050 [Teladorsagia circumcincta]
MSSTTTGSTIRELRRLFAQFGNPHTLVTDNGPQFTSKEFEDFCNENGRYGNRLYDVLIDGQVWKRHANQSRLNADTNLHYSDSTPELAGLPLLPTSKPNHLSKEQRLTQHKARTNTQPSSMDTSEAATLPAEEATGQRRIRQRRAPERLMVDPRKKTYA